MALAKRPDRRLAHGCERLGKHVLELFTVGEPLAEELGLAAELVIRKRMDVRFEGVDRIDIFAEAADVAIVGRSEDAFCHCGEHGIPLNTRAFRMGRKPLADALGNCRGRCKERPSRSQLRWALWD